MTWNVRRASRESPVWDYFKELDVDIALLQEVGGLPVWVANSYAFATDRAVKKSGAAQSFSSVILSRAAAVVDLELVSQLDWVNRERVFFGGNLLARQLRYASGRCINVVSVYSPAWPVPHDHITGIDLSGIKLKQNPGLWVTEILWKILSDMVGQYPTSQWIIGGDFNSSETFDFLWKGGPRGNLEIIQRMNTLGFYDGLRECQGGIVPTFRNTRGKEVTHQVDHLYLSSELLDALSDCRVGAAEKVFGSDLSDHLPIIAEVGETR